MSPLMDPIWILSPTTNGRSRKIVKEANKFSSVSRAANARAKPPIPSPVMRATTSTSKIRPKKTNPEAVIIKTMERSFRNGMNCCLDFWSAPFHFSCATIMTTFIKRTMIQVMVKMTADSKPFLAK